MKMKAKYIHIARCLVLLWLLIPGVSNAAFLSNIPQTVTLPDNSVIHCFATGDEFFNWLHDANGFTLIFGSDGFLYYAMQDGAMVKPSAFRVNSVSPETKGIHPWTLISQEAYQQKRNGYADTADSGHSTDAPHTGTINNLVVYIRFSDQTEFTDLSSFYDNMFNSVATNANSMRKYFVEASYSQLTISSTFYPAAFGNTVVSYLDGHLRDYYRPYNATSNPSGYQNDAEQHAREHNLLKDAVNYISAAVPPDLIIDADNDGKVDNVCFVIRGAEDTWNQILWPHKWDLNTLVVNIQGKRVWAYNVQMQQRLQSNGTGDLAHEMFHTIGAPDLYHYNNPWKVLQPVGRWDLMENNWNPPQHMSAYMKATYGLWIPSIPIIYSSGYYTLNPLNSNSNSQVCCRINSPYSFNEFFVVEYRRKTSTFETMIPGEGLIVYRINTNFVGNAGYNNTTIFDEVYAYRPGGSTIVNGFIDSANYSQLVGRTTIDCSTNPTGYLTLGGDGGLNISEITEANGQLTFLVLFNVPANIVLNQPNTIGLHAASIEVGLQDGFNTTPTNSFRAMIDECLTPVSAPTPILAANLFEVQVLTKSDHWISSYTISSSANPDINSIVNKPDDKGGFLTDGEYKYIISKEGSEIGKGDLLIKPGKSGIENQQLWKK
ncbi:MAG: M6 family metalloprotease domain-containing protein [Bacteroidota bacterium]